jgi:glycosyltransferase involved in cell wall biosynthesis
MRVVHVAPAPFGAAGLFGGGERYPLELARALARHVDCALVSFGARASDVRESSGLRIRTLHAPIRLGGHPAHPIAPRLPLAVRDADVVHVHHLRAAPSRVALLAARTAGRSTAVTDHGLRGGDWHGLLPRLVDVFLTVSAYSAWELRTPPARTRVILGGVDPQRFRPDSAARRRGVLYVGRLTPHKGVDRLIAALPDGAHLTVAGAGGHDPRPPERDYPQLLRRLARGRDVSFLGAVPEHVLPELHRQAEVTVLPSVAHTCYGRRVEVSELLGLAALEAMASATPVVCSRIGGVPEIVEDGVTGFLVSPGDVDALRDRIAALLGDRDLARSMGRRARERVLAGLTWEACAARCLDAYATLSTGRDHTEAWTSTRDP